MNADSVNLGDREFDDDANAHGGKVRVTVTYINTSMTVEFRMPRDSTLKQAFDQGYLELKESPRPDDRCLCEDGASMVSYLGLTLEELHKRKICRKRRFQIAGPTGGA